MSAAPVPAPTRLLEPYGAGRRQVGEWWVPAEPVKRRQPAGASGPLPTVVLVHGGYWRPAYDLHLEDPVAADLAGRGFLVWNVDYAPSDEPWPATLTDVAAAYDFLAVGRFADRVDPARIAVVGHSAGGQLALWLGSRSGAFRKPALLVPQAPVAALADASELGLGSGAVDALLGGTPTDVPDRYLAADPVALLPTGVRTVLVHGSSDHDVPISQSEVYLAAAKQAGDDCTLVRVPGGHYEHLDPTTAALAALRSALDTL